MPVLHFLVGWVYLSLVRGKIARYLVKRLLIQPYSCHEHLIDFVVDLRQRQVDFAFQVQGIQFDQAAGEDVDKDQKTVFVADGFVINIGD